MSQQYLIKGLRILVLSFAGTAVVAMILAWQGAFSDKDPRTGQPVSQAGFGFGGQRREGKPDVKNFNPKQVVRPFPAITDVPIVTADDAEQGELPLRESELVLGVTIGKESRAYPINMLTGPDREIINDTLGGRPIAATW